MIAYCGLDCSKCEGYMATQANDDGMRAQVALHWSSLYGADIRAEHINCDGCKSGGRKIYYCENICLIRKCNIERTLPNCAVCPDYQCEKLKEFTSLAPQALEALEKMRG